MQAQARKKKERQVNVYMFIRRPLAAGDVVKLPPRAIRYEIIEVIPREKRDFYRAKCLVGKYKDEIFESRLIGWKRVIATDQREVRGPIRMTRDSMRNLSA